MMFVWLKSTEANLSTNMPTMIRPNGKAKRIAYNILGIKPEKPNKKQKKEQRILDYQQSRYSK